MLKIFLSLIAMLYTAVCLAGTDVNKANAADLDSIKGIGPSLSGKILDERKKGSFKDWNDLLARVKGMGQKNAAKLSAQGLTVNEAAYKDNAATPATDSAKK